MPRPEPDARVARMQAVLRRDPRVGAHLVEIGGDGVALVRVVPAADWLAAQRARVQQAQARMAVQRWARVFDTAYFDEAAPVAPPGFAGWVSRLTGSAIPTADMEVWRDHTVERIAALSPRHVLEIGCGVGLLLERLAPRCASYRGIDVSAEAVARLSRWTATQPHLGHVELAEGGAHDLGGIAPGSLDTVIINSVIQYFPDETYLRRVLDAVRPLLTADGAVFVGDVRDVRRLPYFHAAIALAGAGDTETATAITRAMDFSAETELAVHPAFFRLLSGYGDVRATVKHAGGDNEMTRYRYDVVLRAGPVPGAVAPGRRAWRADETPDVAIPRRGRGDAPLLLQGIPDARLAADRAVLRCLATAHPLMTASDLRAAARHGAAIDGAQDPSVLVALAAARGHRAEAMCGAEAGCFDLLLSDPDAAPPASPPPVPGGDEILASDPLLPRVAAPLLTELKASLAEAVPQVPPMAFVAVPTLRPTISGAAPLARGVPGD